jgi:hypothetical protein
VQKLPLELVFYDKDCFKLSFSNDIIDDLLHLWGESWEKDVDNSLVLSGSNNCSSLQAMSNTISNEFNKLLSFM